MFFNRNGSKSSSKAAAHSFPHIEEALKTRLYKRIRFYWSEYVPLMEASLLALSVHILAFPILWLAGWALPWPKSPTITTVIEINLEQWPKQAIPEKITDIYRFHDHGHK
ncbi:MAG: hypothetical protein K2X27_02775 [Candidatus Obscuribacterales bacterium]|nr:hypothetical protein [Candidatus Obscuribacterales bacterium]